MIKWDQIYLSFLNFEGRYLQGYKGDKSSLAEPSYYKDDGFIKKFKMHSIIFHQRDKM